MAGFGGFFGQVSMARFKTLAELVALVGQEVAVSEWTLITQEQINQFAQATGDHQWIHVDVERAKAGPFGAPIAHGFFTLSLIARFFDETLQIDEPSMGVNYGLNKVRFMAPVPVGSRLRARLKLMATEPVAGPGGVTGVQMTWEVKIEREGAEKPVCVAESLGRRYPQAA
jgi:acyl dehydratase